MTVSDKRVTVVLDAIPNRDWDVTVWVEGGNHIEGRIDTADRRRIVAQVLLEGERE